MTDWSKEPGATGGCLCGAVRYRLNAPLRHVSACHCGQCLRWHGHVGAYTAAPREAFELLAGGDDGALAWYRSSSAARRGFCRRCGSTLSYEGDRWPSEFHVHVGAMDDPEAFPPTGEGFTEERLSWLHLRVP